MKRIMQYDLPYIVSSVSVIIAGFLDYIGDTAYLLTNLFIHQPEQAFSWGLDNEMILTYVPQPWLLELYNEEPDLF